MQEDETHLHSTKLPTAATKENKSHNPEPARKKKKKTTIFFKANLANRQRVQQRTSLRCSWGKRSHRSNAPEQKRKGNLGNVRSNRDSHSPDRREPNVQSSHEKETKKSAKSLMDKGSDAYKRL